jgi:hypothetical protein
VGRIYQQTCVDTYATLEPVDLVQPLPAELEQAYYQ